MDNIDWEIIKTVGEKHSLKQSAEALFLSQPAISYRLQQLEEDFGYPLFLRNRQGVQFTPQGELLLQYANKMLAELDALTEALNAMEDEARGFLKIGASKTIGLNILPDLLKKFSEQYPAVNIALMTGFSSVIYKKLLSDELHIAIVRGEFNDWYGVNKPLFYDSFYIVSNREVAMDELISMNRIQYITETEQIINGWLKEHSIRISPSNICVDHAETCKQMVKQGIGYSILPGICLRNEPELFIMPLRDAQGTEITRKTSILCSNSIMHFASVKAFFSCLPSEPINLNPT